jgi:hypothetical protein
MFAIFNDSDQFSGNSLTISGAICPVGRNTLVRSIFWPGVEKQIQCLIEKDSLYF